MKKFIDHLEPENIFIVFTHCDNEKSKVDDDFIDKKLAALKKYTKLEIPKGNVIKFDKTMESLEAFVEEFVRGDAHIADEIEERIEEFDDDLPIIAKQVDD